MNVFEALTVNDSFTAALVMGPATTEEDRETYRQLWQDAADAISDVYEAGTAAFLSEYHPGLHARLTEARDTMEAAWGNDLEAFRAAVGEWKDLLLEGVNLFEEHRKCSQQ